MRLLKVLHITSWYPNPNQSGEALWIQRHIESIEVYCENETWHVRTYEGRGVRNDFSTQSKHLRWLIHLNLRHWRFIEWLTFFQLFYLGLTRRKSIQKADVINVHIAYPIMRHWSKLRWLYRKPLVVTEHWSAYHYHFHIQEEEKLRDMRSIFRHPDLLICVSQALKQDITKFSNTRIPKSAIVPNVVDTQVFSPRETVPVAFRFFMLSQWKAPKDPFSVLRVIKKLLNEFPNITLNIGGYGPQESEIQSMISKLNLQHAVNFKGRMTPVQIADEMNRSVAFIHVSEYETFSAVCAEALSCGCPVIASGVGGITDYLRPEIDGILLKTCGSDELKEAITRMLSSYQSFDRKQISEHAHLQFSKERIGRHYSRLLESLVKDLENPFEKRS